MPSQRITPPIQANTLVVPKFEVGLKPIPIENWLLPDDQSVWLLGKNELLSDHQNEVYSTLPQSLAAQTEVCELITNLTRQRPNPNEAPLIAASRQVSDDLIIMSKINGEWKVSAATLCAPTFFDVHHAIGQSLEFLHGPIPTGDLDLSGRIARIFDNMQNDLIMERFNWTIQWSDERFTPNGANLRQKAAIADSALAPTMLFERIERQTIRKLPKSSSILFTIRIRLNNLAETLPDEPSIAAFKNAFYGASKEVRTYKKWAPLERHVAALLATL